MEMQKDSDKFFDYFRISITLFQKLANIIEEEFAFATFNIHTTIHHWNH